MKKHNNIILNSNDKEIVPFTSAFPGRGSNKYPDRDRTIHGKTIKQELEKIIDPINEDYSGDGFNIQFSSKQGFDLKIESLENLQKGIRLLNVITRKEDGQIITDSTVFVPIEQKEYFIKKVTAYLNPEEDSDRSKPKNNDLIRSIESIKRSILNSFWMGPKELFPTEEDKYYEIIIETSEVNKEEDEISFISVCEQNEIKIIDAKPIRFPERTVFLVMTNINLLNKLISVFFHVAEIRPFYDIDNNFFVKELKSNEKYEWCNELLDRIKYEDKDLNACLLDTGIIEEHPLIKPFLDSKKVNKLDSSWSSRDVKGHGTKMAGIILYNDLYKKLLDTKEINMKFGLESIKILPDNGQNLKTQYGNITRNSISIAEISNPLGKRINCLAITETDDDSIGNPSVWSATIDNITYGNYNDDKQLFLISAGNIDNEKIKNLGVPDCNYISSIYSPGQSWNAITVGAYTERARVTDPFLLERGFNPMVESGELSPRSRTSLIWDKHWPIKPEIVCEGGNAIKNDNEVDSCDDVSVLTTSNSLNGLFTTFGDTSCAVAQATNIALQLYSKYKNIWPETIRGLMIHSSSWTAKMLEKYKNGEGKKSYSNLLRSCGYGVPNLEKVISSDDNNVNMIIESEIQPFIKDNSKYKTNEMHFYELPWPKELLQEMGALNISLRITLSYFIEPALCENGWRNRYRYSSCGLRFDLKNTDESKEDFKKRINAALREEENDNGSGTSGSDRWTLGKNNRDVGSIHSDIWTGNAADLSNCNYVAIYPTIGWWRERHNLNKYNNKMRYSLIVSLETEKEDIDLYTPIMIQISNKIDIQISY